MDRRWSWAEEGSVRRVCWAVQQEVLPDRRGARSEARAPRVRRREGERPVRRSERLLAAAAAQSSAQVLRGRRWEKRAGVVQRLAEVVQRLAEESAGKLPAASSPAEGRPGEHHDRPVCAAPAYPEA